jgi:hypothetical protein
MPGIMSEGSRAARDPKREWRPLVLAQSFG